MGTSMRVAQIAAFHQPFEYVERPVPVPAPDEVLIRVTASGFCATDIHLLQARMDIGELPRIPGHETAGVIERVGEAVRDWHEGQRVVVAVDVPCGVCRHCLSGQTQRCQHKVRMGFERDGGHADYVVAPARNLVEVPQNVDLEHAAILPDAVACMWHSLIGQGKLAVNERLLVLGAGGLGLHGIQIGKLAGARVVATSRRRERLLAAERLGAIAVNPSATDLSGAVGDITNGEGVDIVADCIGTKESIQQALAVVRPGGRVLVIAYLADHLEVPSLDFFSREKELIGCRGSTLSDLRDVVHLVSDGRLTPLVDLQMPLSAINEATAILQRGDVVGRIVLTR